MNKGLNIGIDLKDPDSWIQIPQHSQKISIRELLVGNELNQEQSIEALTYMSNGNLWVPSPQVFMTNFLNLRNAVKGKGVLYNGSGDVIPQEKARELWNYFSSTDRTPFKEKACWTFLDANFKEKNGIMYMETNHRVIPVSTGIRESKDVIKLSPYAKSGYVQLGSLNEQGFPTRHSRANNYVQCKNIYFVTPSDNSVARFSADSDGAGLYCVRYPSDTYASLGAFACAREKTSRRTK